MEGLGDINLRSAQTLTRESRINHGVEPNIGQISKILQRRPLSQDRGFIQPVQCDKDGSSGGFRADLVWRDPRPVKSNLDQRFEWLDDQRTAPINDFLIVQVRVPLRQILRLFKCDFTAAAITNL